MHDPSTRKRALLVSDTLILHRRTYYRKRVAPSDSRVVVATKRISAMGVGWAAIEPLLYLTNVGCRVGGKGKNSGKITEKNQITHVVRMRAWPNAKMRRNDNVNRYDNELVKV